MPLANLQRVVPPPADEHVHEDPRRTVGHHPAYRGRHLAGRAPRDAPRADPGHASSTRTGAIEAEITDSIKDNYYKPVKDSSIDENSLKGIVDGLNDRFSHYITPKERDRFEESVSGRFEGVGMAVDQDRRGLKLLNVFKGSPAARAGIRKGWFVTGVDGESIAGVSSAVAVAKIKGPAGSEGHARGASIPTNPEPKTFRLKRESIEVPVTTARLVERDGKKLGVVTLSTFSEGAHGKVRRDVDRLRQARRAGHRVRPARQRRRPAAGSSARLVACSSTTA